MVTNLLNLVLLCTITYYLSGIYGGGLKGKVYDNSFASGVMASVWQRVLNGADVASTRKAPSKDSLPELAKKNVESFKESLPKDSPVLNSKDKDGNIDPRLTMCAIGSVNSSTAQELTPDVAKQITEGKFKTLFEVQGIAGLPACIQGTSWVYLGPNFTVIRLTQEKGKVRVEK